MSAHVFRTLVAGDVNRIQLVQEGGDLRQRTERNQVHVALLFEIIKSTFGSKPCPYCDIEELARFITVSPPDGNHPREYVATRARRSSENLSVAS